MDASIREEEMTFDVDGVRIPAVLSKPEQGRVTWSILIIPGSFYNDVDGNYLRKDGNPFEARPHVYADLAHQLSALGHAVLRYARAGTTVLDYQTAAAHRRFAERAVIAAQAFQKMRELVPEAEACAVAGHSEGSVVALLVSTGSDVAADACISLSGTAFRFFDLMVRQAEARVQDGMASFANFKFSFELYKKSIELVRAGEPVPNGVKAALPPFGVHSMPEIGKQYLRDLDAVDPCKIIADVPCPVLVVQGGQDTSVTPENARILIDARARSKASTTKTFFPELQHFYKRVPPGMSETEAFGLEGESDRKVTDQIGAWLRSIR